MTTASATGPPPPASTPSVSSSPREDTSHSIVVAAFVTWAITVVFVVMRLYTRALVVRGVGPSDWCITLAVLLSGGMSGAMYKETQHGMGLHVTDINVPEEFPIMLYAWWWSLVCYTLTLLFSKISICLLYLTIFTLKWARMACYAVLAIVVVSNIWAFISVLTFTIPLAATWDWRVVATYTTSQDIWWAITGFAVGTDLLIFILPIPIIAPLKLPRRQKIAVVGIFAVGVFTVFVALIRLVMLVQEKGKPDPDFTYNGTILTYWTIIEVNTAIVVACIMTLKPLVSKIFPGLLDSRGPSTESSMVSSDLPLTIGSKPSRNPLSPPRPESWMDFPGRYIPPSDVEAGRRDADQQQSPATTEEDEIVAVERDPEKGIVRTHKTDRYQR
ncbi:hypothetical protein B0T16DRAFT_190937 [Cercophora newfieldiana]|uniref:Rhodopsin domain-containing protein n=1 Tax=Cercophora newfieldiana TaxID=92897 RepID=A0AA40CNV9_9PEZI|nr:hypothetical protein B0T16DRAFT_190937 [Cercophora newfieldiana]